MENIYSYLESLAMLVPVEIYAVVGGLIEEVLAPIPSPLIMTSAGGIIRLQAGTWVNVWVVSLFAAGGKLVGALFLYFLADKMEDYFVPRFGKFFGIGHQTVENLGERFNNGWRDILLLTALRAIPVIPGSPIAVACGAIALDMRTYVISTYIGTFLRSLFFAYIGYLGVGSFSNLMESLDQIESVMTILAIILTFIGIWYVRKLSQQAEGSEKET
jgi:membrane protein DedA with SNARE-associated domain